MRGLLAELRFSRLKLVRGFRTPEELLPPEFWLLLDKADRLDWLENRDETLVALSPLAVEGARDAGRR